MSFADDDIINSLHRFRPKCLVMSNNIPIHYDPYNFRHACHLKCVNEEADTLAVEYEDNEHDNELKECVAVPFVGPYDFHTDDVARKFASIVKEVPTLWFPWFSFFWHDSDTSF